uniref:Condensin-2 complex subunit H2 C-terminal domain-containing protein n=1 Tax=Romanomermis culicivorax TaxID=13658 RepID=A0A915HST7_ROMCU
MSFYLYISVIQLQYFLSSLMLANQGNIEVSKDKKPLEEDINTMKMRFLTSKRHYTQVKNFTAASSAKRECDKENAE